MKYLIANWKANKDHYEAVSWLKTFNRFLKNNRPVINNLKGDKLSIIICPPAPLIYAIRQHIPKVKNITTGAQDISRFRNGSYTGEVTAENYKDLIDYTLIGHSERRKHCDEDNKTIAQKITVAKENNIEPILCIRDENDYLDEANFIAYEPEFAIGTGQNEDLEKVIAIRKKIPIEKSKKFIYGGSVNEKNALHYLKSDQIDGLLVGSASLNPVVFFKIVFCL